MTVHEQVYAFQEYLETFSDKFEMEERPDTDTILTFLNLAEIQLFKDIYLSKPTFRETIEFLQSRQDELGKLLQTTSFTLTGVTVPGHGTGYRSTTALGSTAQYAHYLTSRSLHTRTQPTSVSDEWVYNVPANSLEDLKKVSVSFYNKPILRNPVCYIDGSGNLADPANLYVVVVVDGYTTLYAGENFNLTYVRYPKRLGFTAVSSSIVTTSELAAHLHPIVVKNAVDRYLKEYKLLEVKVEDGRS